MAKPQSLQTRRTPRWLFNFLAERFGPISLDAFADKKNRLVKSFYDEKANALRQPWFDVTFYNPPFKLTGRAVMKAADEWHTRSVRSVGICPVGCSQFWFQQWCRDDDCEIYAPDRRISFDLPDGTPTTRADRDTHIVTFGIPRWDADGFWPMNVCTMRLPSRKGK